MKPDESQLLAAVAAGEYPRDAAARLKIHPNRAAYLFGKWTDRGWYDYGVSAFAGWLTGAGVAKAREVTREGAAS